MHRSLCLDHKLKQAKLNLYHLLLQVKDDSYLNNEVELLYQLACDEQVQFVLEHRLSNGKNDTLHIGEL